MCDTPDNLMKLELNGAFNTHFTVFTRCDWRNQGKDNSVSKSF